jgi:hypothetical protein
MSSLAKAGQQARARAPPLHDVGIIGLVEYVEAGLGLVPCKDALGLGDVAQALGLTSFSSGFQRSPASLCRASQWGRSTSPLGPLKGQNASWPPRIAMCAAAEAAVEQQPPVLISQGQGLHPVHEGAGFVGAFSCAGRFEGCGANREARGKKAIRRVVHAERGGHGCGGGCVLEVHRALDRLSAETEGGGEGCQGMVQPV